DSTASNCAVPVLPRSGAMRESASGMSRPAKLSLRTSESLTQAEMLWRNWAASTPKAVAPTPVVESADQIRRTRRTPSLRREVPIEEGNGAPAPWCILGDGGGIAQRLPVLLKTGGASAQVVSGNANVEPLAGSLAEPCGIVYLAGLDTQPVDDAAQLMAWEQE